MMQYNLSATSLADSGSAFACPSEGELTALTVALLLESQQSFDDLGGRELVLTDANVDSVIKVLEQQLSPLIREFRRNRDPRARVRAFVGLRVCAG